MQVNNSSSNIQVQPFGQTTQPQRGSVDGRDKVEQSSPQRASRIDIDENAISLLEQEKQASNNNTSYDQPTQRNTTAVQTYQSVGNIEQRENVQQLLGVDIFA